MNRLNLTGARAVVCIIVVFYATSATAVLPLPIERPAKPWEHSAAERDLKAASESQAKAQHYGRYANDIKDVKALNKGASDAKSMLDLAKAFKDAYPALSKKDEAFEPDYQPPGAPSVPSKCMENEDCQPCYEKAYGAVNKTRINLERVRAHYALTHRITTQGTAFMQGVANVAGGAAALGAQVETAAVNSAVSDFDQVVRKKNNELLKKLEGNLKEVSACEARFYKNDDWYDRYGFMYQQFMISQYSYVQ